MAGFLDPEYELLPRRIWFKLTNNAPTVDYVPHIYDCEDHAMEFKTYAAKLQLRLCPELKSPLCIGLATGLFPWAENGRRLHVVNFALIDDGAMEWFDMGTGLRHELSEALAGLQWILL
jgi:hypothetical protein